MIVFGVIILTVMLHLLINNQKNLLSDIKEEISKLQQDYQDRRANPPEIVQKGFKRLEKTRERQAAVLDLFSGFVWMFLTTTLVVWTHYLWESTTPAYSLWVPLGVWAVLTVMIVGMFRLDRSAKVLWRGIT